MPIVKGSRVRLNPGRADSLLPPFCYYAAQGRRGVAVEQTKEGAWRVAFDPPTPNAKPRMMVAWDRELLPG
jgi:hypothetical protein